MGGFHQKGVDWRLFRTKSVWATSGKPGFGWVSLMVAGFVLLVLSSIAPAGEKKRVLVLHSYHQSMPWTDNIMTGIQSVFDQSDLNIELYIEYMDTKRHDPADSFLCLVELYAHRYPGRKFFDGIILSDNNALTFLLAHRKQLFPEVPVVFCGINNFEDSWLEGQKHITGVLEDFDMAGTIKLALKLHPKTKQIAVISGVSVTSRLHLQRFRGIKAEFEDSVKFVELAGLRVEELKKSLRDLPENTILLILSYYLDPDGKTFTASEGISMVTSACDKPIYSMWDFFVQSGLTGGLVTSGKAHGQKAAQMAERILRGESPDNIPILRKSPNVPMFNDARLEHFAIDESLIPEGSVILNRRFSFYRRYKRLIWYVAGTFVVLSAFIVALSISNVMRKRALRDLRDSQRRYRALVEEQVEAVCRWAPDMTLTFVNESYCRLFGKSREELLGQKWLELIPPDSRQGVEEYCKDLAENPRIVSYEHIVTAADNKERWYYWTDCPIMGEQGQIEEFQSVGRDSTDRKQAEAERRELEEKIQQTQKLESLGVLAGGIAHDFNNLLVAILGNADLALRKMNALAPEWKHIDGIRQASVRAAELTNQMLAYSGKGRFIVKVFDLTELVREMAFLLEVSISKKIVLKYDFADNLPPVEADAAQIRQVVMNLITNASEAIGDNSGVITISTGAMTIDENYLNGTYLNEKLPGGYYTYVEVSDTGCGIDQEVRAKLFDPFFSTKFTGRGLGLAAVLGIVRGHHGAIKVYSEPSRGSTFRVMLPASKKKTQVRQDADSVSSEDQRIEGGTIMVVDDEESVRNVTKIMLEECGFTVLTACDGRQAVDIFKERSEEINLVLLDMTMPRMDGRDAFREMKLIRDDVKVILSSGYNEQEATSRFAGKGLAGFIQKPYPMKKLIKSIRRALKK